MDIFIITLQQVIVIINAAHFFIPHDMITIISARRVVSLSAGKGGDTETADSEKTANGCRRDIYLFYIPYPHIVIQKLQNYKIYMLYQNYQNR